MASRSDFAPGSAHGIRAMAGRIQGASDEAEAAGREMSRISGSCSTVMWEGAAARKFSEVTRSVPDDLLAMSAAYRTVAGALHSFSQTLEATQASVDREIELLHRAEAGVNAAARGRDEASGRAHRAEQRLIQARIHEGSAAAATVLPDPSLQAQHQRAMAYRQQVEREVAAARQQRTQCQRELANAESELRCRRSNLDALADQRVAAERLCAARIRSALPPSLRDRTFAERLGSNPLLAVMPVPVLLYEGLRYADELHDGAISKFAWELRGNAERLDGVINKLQIAALALGPIAPVAKLLVTAADVTVASVGLATTLTLAATAYPHPDTGRRVGSRDILLSGAEMSLSVVGTGKLAAGKPVVAGAPPPRSLHSSLEMQWALRRLPPEHVLRVVREAKEHHLMVTAAKAVVEGGFGIVMDQAGDTQRELLEIEHRLQRSLDAQHRTVHSGPCFVR